MKKAKKKLSSKASSSQKNKKEKKIKKQKTSHCPLHLYFQFVPEKEKERDCAPLSHFL